MLVRGAHEAPCIRGQQMQARAAFFAKERVSEVSRRIDDFGEQFDGVDLERRIFSGCPGRHAGADPEE
jgi:hypothetical protein